MAVLKSRPKGLHEILYPLPDIRLRFVNNTNEGEIIFRDNAWIFDPPINIGAYTNRSNRSMGSRKGIYIR